MTRSTALRMSLLLSLGLTAPACGGSGDDDGTGGKGGAMSGGGGNGGAAGSTAGAAGSSTFTPTDYGGNGGGPVSNDGGKGGIGGHYTGGTAGYTGSEDGSAGEAGEGGAAPTAGTGVGGGRPFLVDATARLPTLEARCDWSDSLAPRVDHLTLRERSELAAHWAKLGQMEHASIAAFARFSLQLLALGAPPDLVEACTAALADETTHAKLCFGIASAYAGRAIGPGPLDVSHSLDVTSLADVVELVILEGCIGETQAALEAREAAETAADPVIRLAYARIAEDEQRHAELAFRFVRWALERDDGIGDLVAKTLAATPSSTTLDEIVRPCLRAIRAAAA